MNEYLKDRSLDDLLNILVTFQERNDDGYFSIPKNIAQELKARGVELVRYVGRSKPLTIVCGKIYGIVKKEADNYEICDDSGEHHRYNVKLFEPIDLRVS